MARIQTPTNQKRLTNVHIVRLKRGGKRFELAVYPNTVEAYRAGVQKDLDEVLQSKVIFTNVSKGQVAKSDLVERCFGSSVEDDAIKLILDKGELQVGAKERERALEKTLKEIASIVARKSVNPQTMLPYTITLVEKALKDVHYKPNPNKSSKKQAIEAVVLLSRTIPIQRAKMRVQVRLAGSRASKTLEAVAELGAKEESRPEEGEVVYLIAPGLYREVAELVKNSGGSVSVLSLAAREGVEAQEEGEEGEDEDTQEGRAQTSKKQAQQKKKTKKKQVKAKSEQRKEAQLNDLMGVVDDDSDEDWKKKGASKKRGKGKKKGRK